MNQSWAISYNWMTAADLELLADIDRSEYINKAYVQSGDELIVRKVDWQVPDWLEDGQGEHSLYHINSFCSEYLDYSAFMLGAFIEDSLAGAGLMRPNIRPKMAQLAFLHVSSTSRRLGIASQLTKELIAKAEDQGAKQIYVSATPSESAVGFYLSHGFEPTSEPLPELLSLEPEDIHMIKQL